MKKSLLLSLLFLIITSCEPSSDGNKNNGLNRSNEQVVGLFALERFDDLNKRYVESAPVTQGTWDTFDEGDKFDFEGYTWTILMKVSN
tara:strand:- start:2487 stop:2750 length:264 start_codon:yes stop_codon:yes gene_type:complete